MAYEIIEFFKRINKDEYKLKHAPNFYFRIIYIESLEEKYEIVLYKDK